MQYLIHVSETRSETFSVEASTAEQAEGIVREAFWQGDRPQLAQASDLLIERVEDGEADAFAIRALRDFDEACDDDEANVCKVESRIGVLRAHVWGEGAIVVELRKRDGTCGDVALVEATPAELRGSYPSPLHTFAFDGRADEPAARIDCDPSGEEMSYRAAR